MPAINVQNVSKKYGTVQAVDDVTFTVEQGGFFGFLGPQQRRSGRNRTGDPDTPRVLQEVVENTVVEKHPTKRCIS